MSMTTGTSDKIELSIVTITYNERDNVRLFLEKVHTLLSQHHLKGEVIVVDDSSPDGTGEVVKELQQKYKNIVLIQRSGKMGIGSAYRDGAAAAHGKVLTLLDVDLSHPPELIPRLYALAKQGKVCFASRYVTKTKFETDAAHRLGTKLLNTWVSFWLSTKMKDHTNGFICLSREHLQQIKDYALSKGVDPFARILYGITIAAVARKLGLPLVEVEAPYTQRRHGETKIPFWWGVRVVMGDMMHTLKLRYRLR